MRILNAAFCLFNVINFKRSTNNYSLESRKILEFEELENSNFIGVYDLLIRRFFSFSLEEFAIIGFFKRFRDNFALIRLY